MEKKRFKAERLDIRSKKEAEAAVKSVSPCDVSVPMMAPKLLFHVIKLHNVRSAPANILKQESLAVGAEAAVSQWTVNCAKPKTDVILSGTSRQLQKLVAKLRVQGWALDSEKHSEYKALADEIAEAIRGSE